MDNLYSDKPEIAQRSNRKIIKKILLFGVIFTIFFLFIIIAYYLGKHSGLSSDTTPTSTPTLDAILTSGPETETKQTPTETSTQSSKISSKITPSPSPSPIPKTVIINSSSFLDGFRSSNGGGNNSLEIRAGRNSKLVTRGFVSFDISDIPTGVKVYEANLRLYQVEIIGNPYSAGGNLRVDHLTYGDSLDKNDYGLAALSSNFATLSTNNVIGWKEVEVTDRVKNDISNARSQSQFRVHFQNENTGGNLTGDFVLFEAVENTQGTGNLPQLVVKYF